MNPKSLLWWRRKNSRETSKLSVSRQDEESIRSYLLGGLDKSHGEQLEERMLRDDAFVEQVLLAEDELVEDFARGALNATEKEQFKKHFLSTPKRRRKLMLVRALRKYSDQIDPVSNVVQPSPVRAPWYLRLSTPQFRAATLSVLVVAAAIGGWRLFIYRSPVDRGLVALNEAFASQRPLQSRVTRVDYAQYSATRSDQPANAVNQNALTRSSVLLQSALDDSPTAQTHHAVGRLYLLTREFDKAIAQFEEALKSAPNDAQLHSDLGAALFEKGKLERAGDQSGQSELALASAQEHLNQALKLDDSLLDARFNRALLYETLRLDPQALADWEKYISLDPNSPWATEARWHIEQIRKRSETVSRRDADLFNEFTNAQQAGADEQVWRVFSKSHRRTGNYITDTLIDKYLEAATAGRKDEGEKWSQALFRLGQLASTRSGDSFTSDLSRAYSSATPLLLVRFQTARDLMKLAYSEYEKSNHDRAIETYDQARALFDQLGDHSEAFLAQFWMAFCYMQRADTEIALPIFAQLETLCADRNYKWLSAMTQNGLANAHSRIARYSQAVANSWASYDVSIQISDDNGALRALNMLAGLYRNLGNYRQSLHFTQKGLELGNTISADNSQMIGFYATGAWSFNSLGHHSVALEYEKQALAFAQAMKNPLTQSRYHIQMGLIHGMLNDYGEAIKNIEAGIAIAGKLGQQKLALEMLAYGKFYLARGYRNTNQFDAALSELSEVERFFRDNKQLAMLHETLKEQLLTQIAKGEIETARQTLAPVIDAYEQHREAIREESNRNSFFDKEQSIYDVAINFTASMLHDPVQSFTHAENSRARSRLDTFNEGWTVQNNVQGPDLQFSTTQKPMSLDEIKGKLPRQVQLLEFALLQDKLIIWYVSNERFESRTVNTGRDEIAAKVDQLLNLVSRPPRANDPQLIAPATELYNLLIQPVADFLDPHKQLCIVPDKALNLLPFDVLFSSSTQRYLVEDFTLIYASSANTFVRDTISAAEKNQVPRETLLGVGNPYFDRGQFPRLQDLPSAAREVSDIRDFYDSPVVLKGPEPTKARVQAALRTADVLHFATHYISDPKSPMLSKLVLAAGKQEADAVLYAHEIYRLKPLKSRLAILAGCQTGVEGYFNAEGAVGLARPFEVAGVPVVIASLWPVDSDATTDLMIDFHRLRKRESHASAEALRLAQVQMLKFHPNPAYHHPYYWASFVQTGGYSNY